MSIISEYVFNKPKSDEISIIITNTPNEHDKKIWSRFPRQGEDYVRSRIYR